MEKEREKVEVIIFFFFSVLFVQEMYIHQEFHKVHMLIIFHRREDVPVKNNFKPREFWRKTKGNGLF